MTAPAVRRWAAATAVAVVGALFVLVGATSSSAAGVHLSAATSRPVAAPAVATHLPAATITQSTTLRTAPSDRTHPYAGVVTAALLAAAGGLLLSLASVTPRRRTTHRGLPVGRAPPAFAVIQ